MSGDKLGKLMTTQITAMPHFHNYPAFKAFHINRRGLYKCFYFDFLEIGPCIVTCKEVSWATFAAAVAFHKFPVFWAKFPDGLKGKQMESLAVRVFHKRIKGSREGVPCTAQESWTEAVSTAGPLRPVLTGPATVPLGPHQTPFQEPDGRPKMC